jgi:2'-5' RNA ligase
MAKERPKSPRARLFVALDLPARVRAAIAAWGEDALGDPALRRVDVEALHITLAFLGYLPEKEIERLTALVEAVTAPAPRIELLDPVARPPRGRPSLFAVPVRSREVDQLQARLQKKLVAEGLYEPEKRPFWPHITVARVRSDGRGSRRPMRVAEPPGALPAKMRRTCVRVVRLGVYRSELDSQGAKYTPLAQIELPRGRQ